MNKWLLVGTEVERKYRENSRDTAYTMKNHDKPTL